MQDNKAKLIGLVVIALLAVGGTGAVIVLNQQEQTTQQAETTEATGSSASADETASSNKSTGDTSGDYADGSYSATGSYRTPGGTESIDVTVTLSGDTISSVDVTGSGRGDSARYQALFIDGISNIVVGKDIDEINVSRVSGSSLTSTGFNNAIETIKQEAATAA